MAGPLPLLEDLRRRGFIPDQDGEDWCDLPIGAGEPPRHLVRVAVDDTDIIVCVLTGAGVHEWDARLSGGTPPAITATLIDLAIASAVTAGADDS